MVICEESLKGQLAKVNSQKKDQQYNFFGTYFTLIRHL